MAATIIGTAVVEIGADTDQMGQDFSELEKDLKVSGTRAGESFADAIERQAREGFHRLEDDARRSTDSVADSVDDAGKKIKRSNEEIGSSFENAREGFDRVDTGAMGFRDTLTGVQDSMAGTAALAKGDLFNGLFLLGMGIGDLASGMVNFLVPAIKAAVLRFGLMKLALVGLGVAAAATAIGLLVFSLLDTEDASEDTGESVRRLTKDLDLLIETGVRVGRLHELFKDNAEGVDEFGRSVETVNQLQKENLEGLESIGGIFARDVNPAYKEATENLAQFDTALADAVNSGTDAKVIMDALAEAGEAENLQFALANNLLPKFSQAMGDAAQEQGALRGATDETTLAQQRQIAEMDRFSDRVKAMADPVFAFINSQTRLKAAQDDVSKALKENGKNSDEYRDAVVRLAEAEFRSIDAASAMAGASEEEIIPVLQQLRRDGQLSESSFKAFEKALKDSKKAADKLDGTRIEVYRDEYRRVFEQQFSGGNSGASFSTFHEGGIVPGHRGDEILALLEAGELVVPAGKWSDRQSGNSNAITFGPGSIVISVSGDDPHRAREAGGMAADEFLRRLGQAVAVA